MMMMVSDCGPKWCLWPALIRISNLALKLAPRRRRRRRIDMVFVENAIFAPPPEDVTYSPFLCICVAVGRISQKVINGFLWNFLEEWGVTPWPKEEWIRFWWRYELFRGYWIIFGILYQYNIGHAAIIHRSYRKNKSGNGAYIRFSDHPVYSVCVY